MENPKKRKREEEPNRSNTRRRTDLSASRTGVFSAIGSLYNSVRNYFFIQTPQDLFNEGLREGNFEKVVEAIEKGLSPNAVAPGRNNRNLYLIILADSFTKEERIELLGKILDANPSIKILEDLDGRTPLFISLNLDQWDPSDFISAGLEKLQDVESPEKCLTFLEKQIAEGFEWNVAEFYLDKDCFKQVAHFDNNKLLKIAIERRFENLVAKLVELPNVYQSFEDVDNSYLTLLLEGHRHGHFDPELIIRVCKVPGVLKEAHSQDLRLLKLAISTKQFAVAEFLLSLPNVQTAIYESVQVPFSLIPMNQSNQVTPHFNQKFPYFFCFCMISKDAEQRLFALKILQLPLMKEELNEQLYVQMLKDSVEYNVEPVSTLLLEMGDTFKKVIFKDAIIIRWTISNKQKTLTLRLLENKSIQDNAHELTNCALYLAVNNEMQNVIDALLQLKNVQEEKLLTVMVAMLKNQNFDYLGSMVLLPTVKQEVSSVEGLRLVRMLINKYTLRNHEIIIPIFRELLKIPAIQNYIKGNSLEWMRKVILLPHPHQFAMEIADIPGIQGNLFNAIQEAVVVEGIELESSEGIKLIRILNFCKFFGFPITKLLNIEGFSDFSTIDYVSVEVVKNDIFSFFQEPKVYIETRSHLTKFQHMAVRLLYTNAQIEYLEAHDPNDQESAMERKHVARANHHFEMVVKPYFDQDGRFSSYKGAKTHDEALQKIEQDIKRLILDAILNNQNGNEDRTISDYINQNLEALVNGDETATTELTKILTSVDDIAEIAWRAYDKNAAVVGESSLFAPQTHDEGTSLVRLRTAYYYLGVIDERYPATIEDRKLNFLSTIAEIRRAHNKEETARTLPDRISCYPGTIGRMAYMGQHHPMIQFMLSTIKEIEAHIIGLIVNLFDKRIKEMGDAKESRESFLQFYKALTFLDLRNARSVFNNQFDLMENSEVGTDVQQALADKLGSVRQKFINELGSVHLILKDINSELEKKKLPLLDPTLHLLYIQRAVLDVGFGENASRLYDKLPSFVKQEQIEQPSSVNNLSKDASFEKELFVNPFEVIADTSMASVTKLRQLEKRKKLHDTFEGFKRIFERAMRIIEKVNRKSQSVEQWRDLLQEVCQEFPGFEEIFSFGKTALEMDNAFKALADFLSAEENTKRYGFLKNEADRMLLLNELRKLIPLEIYNQEGKKEVIITPQFANIRSTESQNADEAKAISDTAMPLTESSNRLG